MTDTHAVAVDDEDEDAFSVTQLTSTSQFWPSDWWFDCYLPRTTSAEISAAYMAFQQSQQLAEQREKEMRLQRRTGARKGGIRKPALLCLSQGKKKPT